LCKNIIKRKETMASSCNLPLLILVIATMIISSVHSQQFQQQQQQQPLGVILHQVLDRDKNQKVTLDEVHSQIDMLQMLFQGNPDDSSTEEVNEYKQLLSGFKLAAPSIFELLDSNDDKSLSKSELVYVTKFEKAMKKGGGMRELLRDVYSILDENSDELLSIEEIVNGSENDQVITKISARVHELFPLRNDANELKNFVKSSISESIGGGANGVVDKERVVTKGIEWIDDNGDGHISKKEVGNYYNLAGKKFMEISKTIKQLGPMLAMFGGMDMNGGDGFKMDL
jgi:Ca2+-binding EF-hand superfamily protein